MLKSVFADLHIHIGRDIYNKPVKITASSRLTLTNILKEASRNKGIQLIGIIDCHAPAVQEEIKTLLANEQAVELEDGGIQFENVTLLLGSEIEVYDDNCRGPIHVLAYLPSLEKMAMFTEWLEQRMTNITLSSQRYYGTAKDLQYKVKELSGIFIPAHVFTPFKSLYGKGVAWSLSEVLDRDLIDAVELGLSADTEMADHIQELRRYTYVSNSDAHSLAKIGREYQEIAMEEITFKEFYWAMHEVNGRRVISNYGMNPQLGKYHTTVCQKCLTQLSPQAKVCEACGSTKVVKGVADRIKELQTIEGSQRTQERPPYVYQVPLEYLPSLGPKTFEKLLEHFKTEMNVIHFAAEDELVEIVPAKLAKAIIAMRRGELQIKAGGGGKYGSVSAD
ncbi:endonuclease Q family protein [Lentibacillus sp. JNUCC-1]|uniref:endonuclease Q family protein n=1 Tax=Lentibacillus sp. JNUCC-1 TaxID=2654513 RepID=UPI0012E871E5|nr:endonuclease Q family protein [Lentibacillus sp. JNUCC-1]